MTLRELIDVLCAIDWHDFDKDVIADGKLVASARATEDRVVLELVDREDVVS